jgi:hypothetical protein
MCSFSMREKRDFLIIILKKYIYTLYVLIKKLCCPYGWAHDKFMKPSRT